LQSSGDSGSNQLSTEPNASEEIKPEFDFIELRGKYHVLNMLDSGTFATVYKARRINPKPGADEFVAVKRLNCISNRRRMNELRILWELGGKQGSHICKLLGAHRDRSQLSMVIPYLEHPNFQDYFTDLGLKGIQGYVKAMLEALKVLADNKWVHRDIKPCNFLCRPENWNNCGLPAAYMLVDFGLAQSTEELAARAHAEESKLRRLRRQGLTFKSAERWSLLSSARTESRILSSDGDRLLSSKRSGVDTPPDGRFWCNRDDDRTQQSGFCDAARITTVCPTPERSGTRGFRAPEVLFRSWTQDDKVDVWSVGVILLCIMTHLFPFFESTDDNRALAELANTVGKRPLQVAANRIGRSLKFKNDEPAMLAGKIVHSRLFSEYVKEYLDIHHEYWHKPKDAAPAHPPEGNENCSILHVRWPPELYDLLDQLLSVCQFRRPTAGEALEHEFFKRDWSGVLHHSTPTCHSETCCPPNPAPV